jgi:hypothetical protein
MNPVLEEIIPLKKAMRNLAELNNIELDVTTNSDIKEKKQELYTQLQKMM